MSLGGLKMDYITHYDHDEMKGSIQDIRMFDNTNYPMTLDPNILYNKDCTFPNHEILGPRTDIKSENLINFEIIQFHRPLKNDCPF
jgi:hypothetical protein